MSGVARRARRQTQGRRAPRASPGRARRAPGSASPARSGCRTRRMSRSRSPGRLHEGANALVILDARRDLEARARIDGPRPDRLDRVADVLGREAPGKHDSTPRRTRTVEVPGVLPLPGAIDHLRHLLVAADKDALTTAVAVLARVELDEVAGRVAPLADEDGHRKHCVRNGQDARSPSGRLPREDE